MVSILQSKFYAEYYGHPINSLEILTNYFRESKPDGKILFLAGDSTLDNKHYFFDQANALNGYEAILSPPKMKKDVSFWLNQDIKNNNLSNQFTSINAAVEESSIGSHSCFRLQKHDIFIREHISSEDILIVSVGGNDIALFPNVCTICNVLCLLKCTTLDTVETSSCAYPLPCDDYCCGCTSSFLSNFFGYPCGFGYFTHLFKTRVESYLSHLVGLPLIPCFLTEEKSRRIPKKIIVCMVYYVSETPALNSWANNALGLLGYNSHPEKLQTLTRKIYEHATKNIQLRKGDCFGIGGEAIEVIAVPLFVAMDGKDPDDYIQRVEPSVRGGEKIASLLMKAVLRGQEGIDQIYLEHKQKLLKSK